MIAVKSTARAEEDALAMLDEARDADTESRKPFVSLVVPAYNEATILERHLLALCEYMESLEEEYAWELLIINDGSTDETGDIAEEFAAPRSNVRVLHHITNFGLGQAFQFAFRQCKGDYIVTLDLDLSYSPDHIGVLLSKMTETRARIVVASPYMEGGQVSNVPWLRRTLSVWANRFLSAVAKSNISTLTGMVRAYDRRFLQSLDLQSTGMEINPEIIYKSSLLKARIEEVPAHLNWNLQKSAGIKRHSSMKLLRHTMSILLSGFLFKPVVFFLIPGLALLLFALYVNGWMFIHFLNEYGNFAQYDWFLDRASASVAAAYQKFPHVFIVGLGSLMLAIQLIGLGVMSLQSKRYFEEVFHLGTTIYKSTQENRREQ